MIRGLFTSADNKNNMLITSEEAYPVFLEVKRVKETLQRYCLAPDKVPTSLDDIAYALHEEYGALIETKTLPFKSDLVRGMIRIWEPRDGEKFFAQVIIDADLNLMMTRYVQTKELCHVMLHHAENCTLDPTQIITHFVQETKLVTNGAPEMRDVKNEGLADLAAFELLFPHDLRAAAKARIEKNEDTIFGISDWLEIPEHVVEQVLGDEYSRFSDHVWGLIAQR